MALALNGILITANMSGNTKKLSAVLSYLSVVCQ